MSETLDANAMTTLARVQEYLGLSTADGYDDLLTRLINDCSDGARDYLGYDPSPADYVERHDGFGQDRIVTTHFPIISVHALSDNGVAVGAEGSDYFVYAEEGQIALGVGGFSCQRQGVYVYLSAGLEPWPHPALARAIEVWVQSEFSARGQGDADSADRTVKREKTGDYEVEYEPSTASSTDTSRALNMPKRTQGTLDRYRRLGFGGL